MNWPFDSSTPMTRNCCPPMRTRAPSALSAPNSSRLSVWPSTTSARACSGSSGGRNWPTRTFMLNTCVAALLTP